MEAAVMIGGCRTTVLMGHADKCGEMQELGWWLFTSIGHKQGRCCFPAMDVTAMVVNTQQQWRQVWWEMVVKKT